MKTDQDALAGVDGVPAQRHHAAHRLAGEVAHGDAALERWRPARGAQDAEELHHRFRSWVDHSDQLRAMDKASFEVASQRWLANIPLNAYCARRAEFGQNMCWRMTVTRSMIASCDRFIQLDLMP